MDLMFICVARCRTVSLQYDHDCHMSVLLSTSSSTSVQSSSGASSSRHREWIPAGSLQDDEVTSSIIFLSNNRVDLCSVSQDSKCCGRGTLGQCSVSDKQDKELETDQVTNSLDFSKNVKL